MDKVELKVSIETEQLNALCFFMSSKGNTTPQKELERKVQELYEEYVPADTREYLASKIKSSANRPRRHPRKTAAPKPAEETGEIQ